jgi:hypothetical protein
MAKSAANHHITNQHMTVVLKEGGIMKHRDRLPVNQPRRPTTDTPHESRSDKSRERSEAIQRWEAEGGASAKPRRTEAVFLPLGGARYTPRLS